MEKVQLRDHIDFGMVTCRIFMPYKNIQNYLFLDVEQAEKGTHNCSMIPLEGCIHL